MPSADRLKAILYRTRAIPSRYGLRPIHVAVELGSWSGPNTGRGSRTAWLYPITEANGASPKVREVSTEELALSDIGKGALTIGPITPDFSGGGTPLARLKPALEAGQSIHVVITGPGYPPNGSRFMIKSLNTDRGLHWTLTVSPVAEVK